MNIGNNNKYVLKCYLKFFKIVPVEMESSLSFIDVAKALNRVFNLACFHLHNFE